MWLRDGGQCAFVARNGRRCNERGFLEFHHVVPYGTGGEATADNIAVRCRAHNGYEADLYFGRGTASAVKEVQAAYLSPPTRFKPRRLTSTGPSKGACSSSRLRSNASSSVSRMPSATQAVVGIGKRR